MCCIENVRTTNREWANAKQASDQHTHTHTHRRCCRRCEMARRKRNNSKLMMPIVNHFRQVKWLGHVRRQYESGSQATTVTWSQRERRNTTGKKIVFGSVRWAVAQWTMCADDCMNIHSFVFAQYRFRWHCWHCCVHLPTPRNVNLLFYFKNEYIILHRARVCVNVFGW